MQRNWTVFSIVSIVALMLGGLAVVGATQGLFGFASSPAAVAEVRLQPVVTTAGDVYVAEVAPGMPAPAVTSQLPAASAPDASLPEETPVAQTEANLVTYQLGDAGAVTLRVSADGLTVADVTPAPGWRLLKSQLTGGAVEVHLRGATDDVRFSAHIVADEIQVSLVSVPLTAAPAAAVDTSTTYAVAQAGLVRLDIRDGRLEVISVQPAAGWTVKEIEQEYGEIEVEFVGPGGEVEFAAALRDGEIVTYVEVEGSPMVSQTRYGDDDERGEQAEYEEDDEYEESEDADEYEEYEDDD